MGWLSVFALAPWTPRPSSVRRLPAIHRCCAHVPIVTCTGQASDTRLMDDQDQTIIHYMAQMVSAPCTVHRAVECSY